MSAKPFSVAISQAILDDLEQRLAALEEPELLAADIRSFFRPFRGIVSAMRTELFKA